MRSKAVASLHKEYKLKKFMNNKETVFIFQDIYA